MTKCARAWYRLRRPRCCQSKSSRQHVKLKVGKGMCVCACVRPLWRWLVARGYPSNSDLIAHDGWVISLLPPLSLASLFLCVLCPI